MAGTAAVQAAERPAMSFGRIAGLCAYGAAGLGLLYSVTFVAMVRGATGAVVAVNALALLLGGLAAVVVAVGLFEALRTGAPGPALTGLAFGVLAGAGAAVHGAYDLAAFVHPPDAPITLNQVDPRGFLTFSVAGLATAAFAVAILQSRRWAPAIARLGFVAAVLLQVVYVGRLVLLDPDNPVLLGSAAVTGLLAVPAWYARVGAALTQEPSTG